MKTPRYEEEARKIGAEHGRSAASWVELDESTAEAIDQAQNVYDVLEPSSPLSGEWADGYSTRQLAEDCGVDEPFDDGLELAGNALADAYEDAYWEAYEAEVVRSAKAMLPDEEAGR